MQGDELIHYTDVNHTNGEPNKADGSVPDGHIGAPNCWCLPSRFRWNSLTRTTEWWDRDNYEWVVVEPESAVFEPTPQKILPPEPIVDTDRLLLNALENVRDQAE